MSGNIRKIAAMAMGAGTLVLAGFMPATAASSDGAEVHHFSGCTDYENVEVCDDIHIVTNTTETPSGNVNIVAYESYHSTVTDDNGISYSTEHTARHHELFLEGEQHEFHRRASTTLPPNPYLGTCTREYAYHYVDGELQFENFDFYCI